VPEESTRESERREEGVDTEGEGEQIVPGGESSRRSKSVKGRHQLSALVKPLAHERGEKREDPVQKRWANE